MGVIFAASSTSLPQEAGGIPDWVSHAVVYLILSVLVCRALAGGFRSLSPRGVVLAVALSGVYGVTDEYHQSFVPDRHPEAADVAKDLVGAALGGLLYARLAPGRPHGRRETLEG